MDATTLSAYLPRINLLTWRDGIEICFFSSVFYYFSLWLKKDHEKNLLAYFYGFYAIALGAYLFDLSTVTYSIFLVSPAIIMLFMVMHQHILQRNIVALKNIRHTMYPTRDWLDIMLRSALKVLNSNKEALILIEHTDTLASYVQPTYLVEAPLTHGLADMIFDNHLYSAKHMLWLSSNGTVRGIKTAWKSRWHTSSHTDPHAWIDDALAHTTNTDALVLYLNPTNHTCHLAMQGMLYENQSLDQVTQRIKNHIGYPIQPPLKKGFEYDLSNQKNIMAQRTP